MKQTLQEMVRQIRGFTLAMLDRADPEWLLWAPEGTSNHMVWHAGHCLWVADLLCLQRLTSKSELPAQWDQKFGMNCRAVAMESQWPSRDELRELLVEQQQRLIDAIEAMPPDVLVVNSQDPHDLVGGIIHGLHDEAKHHGEMYLLYKMCLARKD